MKMKRFIYLIVCVLFVVGALGSLTACSSKSGAGQAMAYSIASDPKCLDPQIVDNHAGYTAVINSMEGLVRLDENGEIVAGAAESWEVSGDLKTYTFRLRHDVKWLTFKDTVEVVGEGFDASVTAHDFVFGLQRALSASTNSPTASDFFIIYNAQKFYKGSVSAERLGVKAIDNSTVEIRLHEARESFLELLTTPAAMPCNKAFFNATKGKYGLSIDTVLFNGPFYLSSWNTDASLLYRKNDQYHSAALVTPSSLSLIINADEKDIATKVKGDRYSIGLISEDYASDFLSKSKYETWSTTNEVWGLMYNVQKDELKDVRIRRAIGYSVMNSLFMQEGKGAAVGVFPQSVEVDMVPYREKAGKIALQGANAVVAKENWTAGLGAHSSNSMQVVFACIAEHESEMRNAIQEWQRNFGVALDTKITIMEKGELLAQVNAGTFDVAFAPIVADVPNATLLLRQLESTTFGQGDVEMKKLLASYKTLDSTNARVDSLRSIEKFMTQNFFVQPIYENNNYFVVASDTWGIYSVMGIPYFARGESS